MSASSSSHSPLSSLWDLVLAGYSNATRLKYVRSFLRFYKWMNNCNRPSNSSSLFPLHPSVTDNLLAEYMFVLYKSGCGKAEAACTLFGLCMLCPELKHRLYLSRAVLRGYSTLLPSNPHPPMPWTVCCTLAMWLSSNKKFPLAVAAALSFDGYLRIGEMLNLLKDDVAFADDSRLGYLTSSDRVHINIRTAKTGVLQGVEVRDPQVKQLIRVWHNSCTGPKLFPFSESTYRKWFTRGCESLQVAHYTPHSLRHGGATRDFLAGISVNDITVRGRWRNIKTTTRYIQMGPQLMLLHNVPDSVAKIGRIVARVLAPALVLASVASS